VTATDDAILVAPHRFPGLAREERLAQRHGLELVACRDQDELVENLPRARVVMMTPFARLDGAAIASAGRCIGIVRYGVGYDNIDAVAAGDLGIPVANVPDASTEEVALHAVAMAISLLRHLPAADRALRGGEWGPAVMDGARRLSELTVAVIGLGRIGARTAAHFADLGAQVVTSDPYVTSTRFRQVSSRDALEAADIVSLHLPLTEESRAMLDAAQLARMRPGVIIINVSRGGLIDERALSDALHSGQVGGAGVDVFADEPLAREHPLREAPNTILTAHVAWRSDTSLREYQEKAVEQAELALSGRRMTAMVNEPLAR
jgi:D-3-phosphoglycerate dehydrogenase